MCVCVLKVGERGGTSMSESGLRLKTAITSGGAFRSAAMFEAVRLPTRCGWRRRQTVSCAVPCFNTWGRAAAATAACCGNLVLQQMGSLMQLRSMATNGDTTAKQP